MPDGEEASQDQMPKTFPYADPIVVARQLGHKTVPVLTDEVGHGGGMDNPAAGGSLAARRYGRGCSAGRCLV
ncbi:hypothetical protein [Streptomyces spongiae]|uniref:Uncharacterized protein n=1 Tax=Streptomyces spongiae TaxID=565072 RepID=A0A5N8XRP5_9ACTN|nr:hypothetical protein [Streptomyces spongiae]MPY62091.1 hypothetical protein [Streptomyces spongiae]